MHERSCFITLTYNEESIPTDGSLDVKHWQLFAKRLRKRLGPFRFFHCGEYGDQLGRPHYHACLFGQDFIEDRTFWRQEDQKVYWKSELLEDVWGKGICELSDVTFDSAAYVASYVMKKIGGDMAEEHYRRQDGAGKIFSIKPEYITMSRNKGLATTWFEKYWKDVYPDDFVVMKGKKFRPPVFYDLLMEQKDPDMWEEIRKKRLEVGSKARGDATPERLHAREIVARAQLGQGVKRLD